jgi:hypothetical protein
MKDELMRSMISAASACWSQQSQNPAANGQLAGHASTCRSVSSGHCRMAEGSETIVKNLVKDEIYPSRFGMFLALGNIQHVI